MTDNDIIKVDVQRYTEAHFTPLPFKSRFDEYIEKSKAEAIKEFAERLKEKAYPFPCAIGVEYAVTIRAINDLVKEMVGE